jgi:hypothetical protein
VNSLATIASLAPWIGLVGTVLGITSSFRGASGGSREDAVAALMGMLGQSLSFTAAGLLIGLASLWCYRYLASNLEKLDLEMETASLGLMNQLVLLSGNVISAAPPTDALMFGARSTDDGQRDQRFFKRSIAFASAALLASWLAETAVGFYRESLPGDDAAVSAVFEALFRLFASYCVAFPLWVKLLHRKRGALFALASAICLSWTLGNLLIRI